MRLQFNQGLTVISPPEKMKWRKGGGVGEEVRKKRGGRCRKEEKERTKALKLAGGWSMRRKK